MLARHFGHYEASVTQNPHHSVPRAFFECARVLTNYESSAAGVLYRAVYYAHHKRVALSATHRAAKQAECFVAEEEVLLRFVRWTEL